MKIIHTADWHIGSFKGPEENGVNLRSEDTMKCLQELIRVSEKEEPDLVLVSGDIFHQAEIWQGRSHREVLQARTIILELSKCASEVIVMRGTPNHDSEEAFEELKAHFEFVDNVKITTEPEVIQTKGAYVVAIPGFDKGTFRSKFPGLSKEEENQVFTNEIGKIVVGLRGLCGNDKPAILMSHYTVPGCNTESGQTQFLSQFEPVITQEVLISANYDLVALGHIHRPQEVMNRVYYSGAINAMNFNDEEQDRGFWIHNFENDYMRNTTYYKNSLFIKTPYREFKTIKWSVADVEQVISNPEYLPMTFANYGIGDKIVRIIYSCTAEQKKVLNTAQIERAVYEAGAFYLFDIVMEKLESANRTELSKYADPETNLIQYLQEKQFEPDKISRIVEKARPIIAQALANSSVSEFFGTFVPKEIEVKNYRNYVEQSFSFADISFCTINGMNGAGKSSLFMDAIIDCLYEEPREGDLTGWIRNDEKARSGYISFTFGLGEKIFRIVRTRTKSGKATLNFSELMEGEWCDRSKEKQKDTQNEIIRVLGMDSLTFKACVLIMQDQYGLFLEANKEERIGVLSNLLGLGIYVVMEDLSRNHLGDLKRSIADKKRTIEVHAGTIEKYGNPIEEKEAIDKCLAEKQKELAAITKEKEDKKIILRMQDEAEERYKKVQTSIDTLTVKKTTTEQNTASLKATIQECENVLSTEAETLEKVQRHNFLVELDKELAESAAIYQVKADELGRMNKQVENEENSIASMTWDIAVKLREIESLNASGNDEEIREKAAEYEQQKKNLDKAYEDERLYRSLDQSLSNARYRRASIVSDYETKKKHMEITESNYKKKSELLENVECVDINNAKCGFLADAISAKKMLSDYPAKYEELEHLKSKDLLLVNEEISKLTKEIEALNFDEKSVLNLAALCEELKPYLQKLNELNQKETNIALIRASIENIQLNISESEKRLSEVKLKATEIEESLPAYQEAEQKHRDVLSEIAQLSIFVEKANTYPVIKERKANAENQRADAFIQLQSIIKELSEAREELARTEGATLNVEQLRKEIELLDERTKQVTNMIENYQLTIGALIQKIEEIDRLNDEISGIQKKLKDISIELSEYDVLKAAFSQDGIPHQIIRSLVPRLTETANSILGQMTGGKMGIEFQTEKVMKSNSNKEVVTLDILIEEYGKSILPYLSKSGGEKVKASLSVILALAEIKSSSAGIQLGMLFIDEPPFLDSDGIQAYCDALETIQSRYPDLKIMAITHDPTMKARFPQSLDVIKTDDGSKVIFE